MDDKTKALLDRLAVPKTAPTKRKSILIKGAPGTGKTYAALNAPGSILAIYNDTNRGTLNEVASTRDDIFEIHVNGWKDFDPGLVNAIKNRELEFENIVVDSLDMLYNIRLDEQRGAAVKLNYDGWTDYGNTLRRVTYELVQACRPQPNKPDYNVICVVKMQDKTDSDGGVVSYETAIQGGFRSKIESYFDYVLLADSETTRQAVGGQSEKRLKKDCFLWTVPPTRMHTTKAPLHWPAKIKGGFTEIQKLIDTDLHADPKMVKSVKQAAS